MRSLVGGGAAAVLAALTLALAPGTSAAAGRIAIGVEDNASLDAVAAAVERLTGSRPNLELEHIGAMIVRTDDDPATVAELEEIAGVDFVERVRPIRRLAFAPTDPLVAYQWYLDPIQAFSYWEAPPVLGPVSVAVIDSGIDVDHPEFAGRIADTKSFVSSKATVDSFGHGTFVAGEIAAALDNGQGIAGVAFPASLLVAKVVSGDGTIDPAVEARGIQWAVDQGARVINLSLGGPRDPSHPSFNYSALEQAAIQYAYSQGVVVVAAAGNCDPCPGQAASYPAALAHVIGVAATNQRGIVSSFSNTDPRYVDIAAPGVGIISTVPVALSSQGCEPAGYSYCASNDLVAGSGTSFSTPLVAAAAALLLASNPALHPSQVMTILESTTADIENEGRDAESGFGLVSIRDALAGLVVPPPLDRGEVNDDVATARTLYGNDPSVSATIDWFDDPEDVYRVHMREGSRVTIRVKGPKGQRPSLAIWRPGTKRITPLTQVALRSGAVVAYKQDTTNPSLSRRIVATGWYFVNVKAEKRRGGPYTLTIAKRR